MKERGRRDIFLWEKKMGLGAIFIQVHEYQPIVSLREVNIY
jgi:hypothetical protein